MSQCFSSIGEHVEKISNWNPAQSLDSSAFKYIDLSSVDKDKKVILLNDVPLILPAEAPSRARQLVKSNDVIVSTVRPNLNGVGVVPDELHNATASTGYCILRANNSTLDCRYLYYWVRTNSFVEDMMKKATGANYPAVSDKIIKESKIPLPPLSEQKRIAAILDKADSLRRKRQQAIQLADQFLCSVFLDLFGDPVTNPKGWPSKPLSELAPSRPIRNISVTKDEDVWLLNLDKVESNSGEVISKNICKFSDVGSSTLWFDDRHVLYSKLRPYLNKVVFPNEKGLATSELLPLKPDPDFIMREYLVSYLRSDSFVNWANRKVAGAKMPRLSTNELWNHSLAMPPMNLQMKFAKIFHNILNLKTKQQDGLAQNDNCFDSLSQKAFAGEL